MQTFKIGRVRKIEERAEKRWLRGAGSSAETEDVSTGWFVVLDTGDTFGFGAVKPECAVGDEMRATFERSA